jgi:G3E family GTPase
VVFLGSGKTTAIVNACQHLIKKDQRVVVITNDQGDQQVDNAFVKSFGYTSCRSSQWLFFAAIMINLTNRSIRLLKPFSPI